MSDVKYYIRCCVPFYDCSYFVGPENISGSSTDDVKGFDSKDEALKFMKEHDIELGPEAFIVDRGKFQNGDELELIGVHWNEDKKKFVEAPVKAKFKYSSSHLSFEERTLGYWGVSYDFIGKIVVPDNLWENDTDWNAVFCWPDEGHVAIARKRIREFYRYKVRELTKELDNLKDNLRAMIPIGHKCECDRH